MIEEWKDIPGYEGRYQISSHGRVKSLSRPVCVKKDKQCRIIEEKIMVLHENLSGYKVVWLRFPGTHRKFFVHRLVAIAFLENPDGKETVNHKNKDRTCNTIDNLEWMTFNENQYHRVNYCEDAF